MHVKIRKRHWCTLLFVFPNSLNKTFSYYEASTVIISKASCIPVQYRYVENRNAMENKRDFPKAPAFVLLYDQNAQLHRQRGWCCTSWRRSTIPWVFLTEQFKICSCTGHYCYRNLRTIFFWVRQRCILGYYSAEDLELYKAELAPLQLTSVPQLQLHNTVIDAGPRKTLDIIIQINQIICWTDSSKAD